ncbi:MAG: ABC transporter permease [Oligoflexia bacterium]|nr:ABC transporter permease [Oligoflexia bacterium]
MFFELLIIEIKNRLWRLSSLIYFLLYLFLAFMISISFAGAFKGATVSLGFSNKLALNSPVVINFLSSLMGYIGLLVVAPLFGQSINKDFENKFAQILFLTPIKKRNYFFVRYFGSFISSTVIMLSISIGIWLATLMPFIDRTLVSENHLWFYISPYLTNVIPNILIFGAIFIAVVSFFKKMAPVYIASIVVFTGWLIAGTITSDLENKFLAAMIDPLGIEAFFQLTRYWSVIEQSTTTISLTGVLLYNRLIWGSIGFASLLFAYLIFNPFRLPNEKKQKTEKNPSVELTGNNLQNLSEVKINVNSYKVFWGLAISEFKQAFSNIYFLIILLCGIIYIFAISGQVGKLYGTETLPVTYHVLELIGGSFGLFVIILTTFYGGELIWKDRDHHFFELIDSRPISNSYLYLSKLFSLVFIQIFLAFIILICCVIIQSFKGYFNFEWKVYFYHLFIYSLPSKIMISILILFIQSLSANKYIGHTIVIFYYLLLNWLPNLGLDHYLYLIGQLPYVFYSDMNQFGTSSFRFMILCLYWGFFHLILLVLTILIWKRGMLLGSKVVFVELGRRLNPHYKRILIISCTGWILSGIFIFYNTNILNTYKTTTKEEQINVDYELLFKHFEKGPSPEIIAVQLNVDIFPETQSLYVKGKFQYKNKSNQAIKKILINTDTEVNYEKLSWNRPLKIITDNKKIGVQIIEFDSPLLANEEITLSFVANRIPRGFTNSSFSKKIVQNGSFFYGSDLAPIIGYSSGNELTDDKTRRKYKLAERPRMANINDKNALSKTYISNEGYWITFEATVSTSKDQIAIAPGYLEKEWLENDRRYFHYKMDRPMLNFYCFLSARYQVVSDKWNDVKIEVYHHLGHTKNISRMINAVKKSLDYYSKYFSPYQFKQFRIIEFPRYQQFAQAFPNTIPYSESMGFIAKVNEKDPESIDYPFYVTAHELAHQWWAHQLSGGNVQGVTMLSESLAQYSALMVQEKEYGPKQMKKFLKYELDHYLSGRSTESKKELPLYLNENQPYIHYNKGSIVFYALKDYLGEEVVNKVLSDFIKDFAYKRPPLPRSIDLVERFKKITPVDKKYLIEDLFETITFYDNKTDSVLYKKENGKYKVTIVGYSKKIRSDELGAEKEIFMNDFIDVGLFDKDGNIIYLNKHQIKSGENKIELLVDKEPFKGGIDPINKLIDKISDDNSIKAVEP